MPKLEMPLVSVLMPAFNTEAYIADSIESILRQSFKNFELVILDDASSDRTYEVIQNYAKKDERIRVYKNKKNLNIAETRNKLVDLALGIYIAWQDADDISTPDRLESQVKCLEKYEKVGMVGGFLQFFGDDKKESIRKYNKLDKDIRKNIFFYSPVAQPVAMIRKEALTTTGKYGKNLSPAEDIDMSFRIGENWEFYNIQKVLLKYRNHYNSSTYKKLKKIELVTIKTRLKYFFNSNYSLTVAAFFYNIIQFISIFVIPARIKIKVFNLIRNS